MLNNSQTGLMATPTTLFNLAEIIERILSHLDNSSLLEVRLVGKLWSQEAERLLLKRRYCQTKNIDDTNRSEFEGLLLALKGGSLKPSILIGTGSLFISLNERRHPKFQTFMHKYGLNLKTIQIYCHDFINPMNQRKSSEILFNCQNIETLKLNFYEFHNTFCECNIPRAFIGKLSLRKLTTLRFEPIVKDGSFLCYYKLKMFYLDMLKKIIKSTDGLKHLGLKVRWMSDYLQELSKDFEIKEKLKQVETLRLYDEGYLSRRWLNLALVNFLPSVSSSLTVLYLVGLSWGQINLSEYPLLPQLRTLIIKAECYSDFHEVNLSCDSLPNLRTLILGDFERHPINLDFGWPFSRTSEQSPLIGLNWEEDMKCFLFECANDMGSKMMKPVLNVVLYVAWGNNKTLWLNRIFNEFSRIQVTTLFVDILPYVYKYKELKKLCENRCSQMPGLKCCVIRTVDEPYVYSYIY